MQNTEGQCLFFNHVNGKTEISPLLKIETNTTNTY